jgi:hypothetical protein
MELYIIIILIILILVTTVIYQGKNQPFSIKITLSRILKLLLTTITYFKEVGVCMAVQFKKTEWDMTNKVSYDGFR